MCCTWQVVLLHGLSSSSRVFEALLAGPVGQRNELIAVDLPGHGASSNALVPAKVSSYHINMSNRICIRFFPYHVSSIRQGFFFIAFCVSMSFFFFTVSFTLPCPLSQLSPSFSVCDCFC